MALYTTWIYKKETKRTVYYKCAMITFFCFFLFDFGAEKRDENNVRVVVVVAVWYSYTPFHRLVMVPYTAEWLPVCNQHTYSRIFMKGRRRRRWRRRGGTIWGIRWTREIYVDWARLLQSKRKEGKYYPTPWLWLALSIKNGHKGNENGGKLEVARRS